MSEEWMPSQNDGVEIRTSDGVEQGAVIGLTGTKFVIQTSKATWADVPLEQIRQPGSDKELTDPTAAGSRIVDPSRFEGNAVAANQIEVTPDRLVPWMDEAETAFLGMLAEWQRRVRDAYRDWDQAPICL